MPDKIQVSIVGLGALGASAGLALRRLEERVTVVGHDRTPDVAGGARKIGAVERVEWGLPATVAGADRIILAVPLSEMRDVLEGIADNLRPGCVILDTCPVKVPVLAWARELLPPEAHFVGGHPIVITAGDSQADASGDLYRDRLFALTPEVSTDGSAVQLAADLATALGAKPYFMDAHEHDGLAAGTEQAPALMAAALMTVAAGSRNWRDLRKVAAGQFYGGTLIVADTGPAMAAAAVANREPVLHWLDALAAEVSALRQRVADGDEEGLAQLVEVALAAREGWLAAYETGRWEEDLLPGDDMPNRGSMLRQMLGFGGRRGPAPEPGKR